MMFKKMIGLAVSLCCLASVCFSQTQEKVTMANNPVVLIKTNLGIIKVELDAEKAPLTVQNFLQYVKDGHFSSTIFHRVIPGFMVQGGGFTADFKQKPTRAPIKIESDNGLKNLRGTIAMARTNDPNSATAQFFINLVDNSFLDYRSSTPSGYGYTVFGKVVEGMNVVDEIGKVKTGTYSGYQDVPTQAITIESIVEVPKEQK